ncbi:PREDICTED: transcriptional corepressor SEUSS-like isoform X1 [Lupinus angustifolius]|nr:PREDICTED: transcriptional corepressor SEUSS-like isoform X1 [Lupinus angustifolius]
MKDLIDYSRETGTGPMESLAKFPRRNSSSAGPRGQAQQHEDQLQQQQMLAHNSNGDQTPSSQPSAMQIASNNGIIGMVNINNSITSAPASTTTSTIVGLLHQNSMNSRQNSMNNASSPYGGSSVQIPSPGSSSTMPQAQPNLSPFQAPTPSSSNNPQQASRPSLTSANHMSAANSPANISMQQQPSLSGEADPGDAQSSVQKFIHEMLMSSQMNGSGGMVGVGSLGNDMKNVNGVLPMSTNTGLNSGNGLMGNGALSSNSGVGVGSYGTMNLGQSAITNGMRAAMGNNSVMNGRGGMASVARDQAMNHQQDLSNQLLSGLGSVNGFNNLQFDWKPSP